jgi:hypothetical protein
MGPQEKTFALSRPRRLRSSVGADASNAGVRVVPQLRGRLLSCPSKSATHQLVRGGLAVSQSSVKDDSSRGVDRTFLACGGRIRAVFRLLVEGVLRGRQVFKGILRRFFRDFVELFLPDVGGLSTWRAGLPHHRPGISEGERTSPI